MKVLDAQDILSMKSPGDLFSPDVATMKTEYKRLAKIWHPDVHDDPDLASRVMSKINELYGEGMRLLQEGRWTKSNFVQFRSLDGKLHNISYLAEIPFELGKCYICNSLIVYVVKSEHRQFFDNCATRVENLKFADRNMESEFRRFLPKFVGKFETSEELAVVMAKPSDFLSLRHVLEHFGGKLPDRHVAWILSSLYNLACFLQFNGIVHNGITIDSYFISPAQHNGMLLGGWWYSTPVGERMLGIPKDVFDILTFRTKSDKTSVHATDLNCIRQLGRQLLGDISGRTLKNRTDIPRPILDWVLGASTNEPMEEYVAWEKTLDAGYGKRKFVHMNVSAADLYKK